MTRDDIVKWAAEAGIMPPDWGATENQWRSLHAFAELTAAAEREACAKVADSYDVADDVCSSDTAEGIAYAIRQRGAI